MYWKTVVAYYFQCLTAESIFSFDRLIAIADTTAEHDVAGLERLAFALWVKCAPQKINGIRFDGDIRAKFTVDVVTFSASVAIYTVVGATPIKIHAVS